jgi:predicted Zn-dependent peptidase
MRIIRAGLVLLAAISLATLPSCGKDEQEAQKFDRAEVPDYRRDVSDVTSMQFSNGMTLYLQEERTDGQVAVEVLYPAGYVNDPRGKVQLSHLTEHLAIYCATGEFGPGGSLEFVKQDRGMIAAESVAEFVHIDYVVKKENLEPALAVEASRLKEIRCDEATLRTEAEKAVGEIDKTLADPKGTLTRFALMALVQIVQHGQTRVPIYGGMAKLTIDDAHRYHDTHFRTGEMVMVLIGDFQKAEAEALVRKHFEGIPARPAPPEPKVTLKKSIRATWDIESSATAFIAPGPYTSYRERMILSMFGAFFQQLLNSSEEVYTRCQYVYCSNQVYRVGQMPFFILAAPKQGFTNQDIAPVVIAHLGRVLAGMDDKHAESIKTGLLSYMSSTMLKTDVPDYPLMHHQVIGQEALNVGLKHLLREGRSGEEFAAEIQSITPDEVRTVLRKYLDRAALLEVSLEPGR